MPKVAEDAFGLIKAAEYIDNIQIHRAACKELLNLLINNHEQICLQEEWPALAQEICESLKLWSELDELERLMQCDNIPEMLSLMRSKLSHFGVDCEQQTASSSVGARVNAELLSSVLSLLGTSDGLDRLECLPAVSLHKAMSLFQRVLDTVSPASPQYMEVHDALMRLQRADTAANLEAPDLTPHISDISDEPIAKGGFSDVYTGEWLRQDKVALKILRILGGSGASRRHKLLRREVKLWHDLRHPHLLQFWGLCNTAQGLAMVSPFLPDGNAPAYLAANPDASAMKLLVGAAYGLEYLHTRQPSITHGDLRGANILVSQAGEACLADFGLSKIMETASGDSAHGTHTTNAGSARWMAPELLRADGSEYPPSCPSPAPGATGLPSGNAVETNDTSELKRGSEEKERYEGVTPRTDVWAFGMTVYELMSGRVPFYRIKNNITAMMHIMRGDIPGMPTDTRSDWVPELYNLMQDCWNPRPHARPSMSQVSDQMRMHRETSRRQTLVPESLLLAMHTPLQPLSPGGWFSPEPEESHPPPASSFICDSPTAEKGPEQPQFAAVIDDKPPMTISSIPPRKRKSTAEESVSKREAADDVPPLPILSSSLAMARSFPPRPRSRSAPMAIDVPSQFTLKDGPLTSSPTQNVGQLVYQSANPSQTSLASNSNNSRFSKPSRPATPSTPVPEDSGHPRTLPPSRNGSASRHFGGRVGFERVPAEASSNESSTDPLKVVLPILLRLISEEDTLLANNFDAGFSSRLRRAGPSVVELSRVDLLLTQLLGGYVKLRKQHRIFLNTLKSLETMSASEVIPGIRTLLKTTFNIFGAAYPKYAFDVYRVEEVLSEEKESNFPFRAWLQSSDDEMQLLKFIHKPLTSIESIFVSLSQWIAYAKLKAPKDMVSDLKTLEHQLVSLLMRTRLGRWQGAKGRDSLLYKWRQLVARGDTESFEDEARQSAMFRIIEALGGSIRMMQGFHSAVLKRIVMAPNLILPHLTRVYEDLGTVIDANSQLLTNLYTHQMECHPRLTRVSTLIFEAITGWADLYSLYCAALMEALEELQNYSAEIFPLIHVITHPVLKDQDVSSLLWLPIIHLRRLSRALFALLEETPDTHEDLKTMIEAISTLNKLVELCDSWTTSVGTTREVRQISAQLQWAGEEDITLALDSPDRRIIHSGRLLLPQSDTDSFLDLFVVLMDNCLLITHPKMRWGLSMLQILHTMLLENMSISDLDQTEELYLLDGSDGETLAAPLPIRYEMHSTQNLVTLLCFTTLEAIEWRRHIASAKVTREGSLEAFSRNIFERGDLLTSVSFHPSCSVNFTFGAVRYFVVGGQKEAGLWIRASNERGLRQILTGVSVKQCEFLPSMGALLILSDKSLLYFKLEDLLSTKIVSRQVDTKGPVIFFRTGMHKQSLVLMVAVATNSKSPRVARIYGVNDISTGKSRRSSIFGFKDIWSTAFKQISEITVANELYDFGILDDMLFLLGMDGFMNVKLENWEVPTTTIYPVFKGLASSQTYHRCKTSKPVKICQSGDVLLLCYTDFGIHINRDGQVQGQCINWKSDRVTNACSRTPYVFLLSTQGIEARIVQTGRLVDYLEEENIWITMEMPSKGGTTPRLHLAGIDQSSSRGFELPTVEPCSIYEWRVSDLK